MFRDESKPRDCCICASVAPTREGVSRSHSEIGRGDETAGEGTAKERGAERTIFVCMDEEKIPPPFSLVQYDRRGESTCSEENTQIAKVGGAV